jgi:hypothetical protein
VIIAQEETRSFKNVFSLNVTRLYLKEVRLGYERQLADRHVLRTTLGYEFSNGAESFKTFNITPFNIPIKFAITKGIYVALGYNYFFNSEKNAYVSAEVYYNNRFYDDKYFMFCVGSSSDSYVDYQSMDLKKSGIKFLIGKKVVLGNSRILFDFFAGLGIQYRAKEITIYKSKYGECTIGGSYDFIVYDPPKKDFIDEWRPSLQGGFLLSFLF